MFEDCLRSEIIKEMHQTSSTKTMEFIYKDEAPNVNCGRWTQNGYMNLSGLNNQTVIKDF